MKNSLFACVLWTACLFGLLEAASLQFPAETPCIKMEMDAEFNLTDGFKTKQYSLESGNVTGGDCNNIIHNMQVTFPDENSLRFTFLQGNNSDVQMDMVFTYDPSWFINGTSPEFFPLDDEGITELSGLNQVYECNAQFEKNFPAKNNNISMIAEISNVKIQAYNLEDGNFSSDVFVCAQDQTTSVAPSTTNSNSTTQPPVTSPNATEPQTTNTTDNTSTTNQQTTETSVTTSEATTTVGPTMAPPTVAEFTVTDNSTGKVCLILKGALQLQVKYEKKDKSMGTAIMNIPKDASSTGTCSSNSSSLTLKFGKANATRTVTFNFENKEGSVQLSTWEVSLDLDEVEFPDHLNDTLNVMVTQDLALSNESMYFMCDAKKRLTDTAAMAIMFVTEFKVQAFKVINGTFSQYGVDCSDDIPYVPKAKSKDTFSVREKNETCIVFQAEMVFDITYLADGKNKSKQIYVPNASNVTVDGSCNSTNGNSQWLSLVFYNDWMLKMTFVKSGSSVDLAASDDFKYHLGNIELTYTLNSMLFPDATYLGQSYTVYHNFSSDKLSGNKDGSYMCTSGVTLDISNDVKLTTTNLQYQAFKTNDNTNFGTATECKVDEETNSIVPIAVGAALAGLVVIVLIAYLIGRRRSRTGYEQV